MKILNLIEWKISQCGIKDGSVISWMRILRCWDSSEILLSGGSGWPLGAGLKNKIHQMRIKWSWTSAFTRVYYKIIQQRDEILFQFFQIITKSKKPINHDHDTNWKPLSGSISQKLAEKLASFKIEKTFQFQEKWKKTEKITPLINTKRH